MTKQPIDLSAEDVLNMTDTPLVPGRAALTTSLP